jgi:predicted XRE-type DNA-binding protein
MPTPKLKTSTITLQDGTRETITHGTDNIFADLGLPNPEEHLAKSGMVMEIAKAIKARGLTQREAAKLVKMDQPTLSKMLRGQFSSISMDRLFDILNRLGRHVEIHVKPVRGRQTASTRVVRAG